MEVRTKDQIFVIIVGALALAAAYVYFYRLNTGKMLERMERREAAIVTVEDFPDEKQRAERERRQAAEALETERAIPAPAAKVMGSGGAVAEREREVIAIFRAAGLRIIKSELARGEGGSVSVQSQGGAAVSALKATGAVVSPEKRLYELSGAYPQILVALQQFCDELRPVIVESASLENATKNIWKLTVVF